MKKALMLLFTVLITVVTLFSCKGDAGADGGTQNGPLPDGDYIFAKGSTVSVICNTQSTKVEDIAGAIKVQANANVNISDDKTPKAAHEIIIGKADRELSAAAYRQLERIKEKEPEIEEEYVGYVIYSDGKSVAIAYDVDEYGYNTAEELAIEYFRDEIVKDNTVLRLNSGVVKEESFDLIAYMEAIEDREKADKWANVKATLSSKYENGAAIADALRYYVEKTGTDGVVSWLADLYDLDLGGFYFSNSGRNTEGYLPDIESTSQAVGFFISSGMFRGNYDYPDWFADKLVYFVKSLQDPNGYIYHPQWDRETLEKNTQRLGRDCGSAYQILQRFNAHPTYPLQGYTNKNKENYIEPDYINKDGIYVGPASAASHLTWTLNTSMVNAVSKVVPTAVSGFSQLESLETFKDYLDDMYARNQLSPSNNDYRSFYQIANEMCTNANSIIDRDAELENGGAFAKMAIDWMNENQNKDTGLWDKGVGYANTNAYYKAINFYNALKAPMPNVDKAIDSIITILMSDDPVDTVLYTFNVWGSLNQTIINLRDYAKNTELINSAREKLIELAPEAIMATANIQLTFKKADGSFGYFVDKTTNVSQSMPVAVANTNEGDVNCTTLSIGGILSSMCKTLDVAGVPANYTRADGIKCMKRIKSLGTIIKDSDVEVEYFTFDDDTVGAQPIQGISKVNFNEGYLKVIESPTKQDSANKAVEFYSPKVYQAIQIPTVGSGTASTCFVFEGDFCIPVGGAFSELQVLMQNAVYMTTIKTEGNSVRVWETSSRKPEYAVETEIDACAEVGEWFNLRMEFYIGDKTADTVRAKLYFNGKLVSVTDNFFDDTGAKLSGDMAPRTYFEYVNIISVSSYETTIQMDNIAAYATSAEYKVEKNVEINIDAPDRDRIVYDFDDGAISEDINVNSGAENVTVATCPDTQSQALKLSGGSNIYIPTIKRVSGSGVRTAVFESDVYVGDSTGNLLRLAFCENNTAKNILVKYDLKIEATSEGNVVKMIPISNKVSGGVLVDIVDPPIDGISIPVANSFNLRIEYFEEEFAALIFVNDTLLAMCSVTCSGAPKYITGLLNITVAEGSTNTIYLDNIVAEKDKLFFADSAAPEEDPIVHDFSKPDNLVTMTGGAAVVEGAAKISAAGDGMKVLATQNGVVLTAASVSSDIILSEDYSGTYRFILYSEDGKAIIAFDLKLDGKNATVIEYYAGGNGTAISKTAISGKSLNLSFAYYYKERVMAIFINDNFVALNSLGYVYENETLSMSYMTVAKIDGAGSVLFDNVTVENTVSFYVERSSSDKVLDPKNDATFESSYAANPPTHIKYAKSSTGSLLGVKGMKNKAGQYTKFLSLYTTPGGNDILDVTLLERDKLSSAKAVIFETDIYFDCDDDKSNAGVEIYFVDSAGNKIWYTAVTYNRGGTITLSDYSSTAGASSISGVKLANETTVFNLRLEYIVIDGRLFVNFYVDNEFVCTSTMLFRTAKEAVGAENISTFKFYTANAASGRMLIDNSRIYHSSTYTEFEIPELPEPDPEPPVDPDPKPEPEPDPKPEPEEPKGPETGEVKPSPNPDAGFDNVEGVEPTEPDNGSESDGGGWT